MRFLCLILTYLVIGSHVYADYISFRGDISNEWNDARNWNPARVPLTTDSVEIGNQNTAVLSNLVTTIKYLKISGRAILTIDDGAELRVSGASNNGLEMVLRSSLNVNGTLVINNIGGNGLVLSDRSMITNMGHISITNIDKTGLEFITNSTFMNEGRIEISTFGNGNTSFYGNAAEFMNGSLGAIHILECPGTITMHIDPSAIFSDNGTTSLRVDGCG